MTRTSTGSVIPPKRVERTEVSHQLANVAEVYERRVAVLRRFDRHSVPRATSGNRQTVGYLMTFVAKIEARAYSRATELPDRVESALLNLFPEDIQKEVVVRSSRAEGHSGYDIQVIRASLKKEKGCEFTLDHIFTGFDDRDRRRVKNSLLRRLDENCSFFLRIDKQAAFLGKLTLADGPDVISVRIDIKQYPKCKQEDTVEMLETRLRVAGGED
jgi:RNA binding exosome subunit